MGNKVWLLSALATSLAILPIGPASSQSSIGGPQKQRSLVGGPAPQKSLVPSPKATSQASVPQPVQGKSQPKR